jgi:hypothetical protein
MTQHETTAVVIPLSKSKIMLMLLGSMCFVGVSVWLWCIAGEQDHFHPLKVRTAAVAGVSFFGLCAVYGCLKLFDGKPGLIIDSRGIVDNSSGLRVGHVPWTDITGVKVTTVSSQ